MHESDLKCPLFRNIVMAQQNLQMYVSQTHRFECNQTYLACTIVLLLPLESSGPLLGNVMSLLQYCCLQHGVSRSRETSNSKNAT
jgi:hypothetical protein